MKNRILFYSNVSKLELFNIQQFYKIDIEILKELGFEVIPSNRIRDFFKFWTYNIGFLYFYKYSFFSALVAKIFHKKVFFTGGIDDLNSSSKNKFLRQKLFFRLCYLLADKCIIVSNGDYNNIIRIYNNKLHDKLYLSPHGINIDKFICDDIEKKKNYFSTVVWQESVDNVLRKGVDKALFLFSKLIKYKDFSDFCFYIIGMEGEGTNYLKKIAENYKIDEKVIFLGSLSENDKISYLKNGRFYFQLSSYEGFGIAALEALAASNIVIHSGMGGLQDIMEDDGILLNINDNHINVNYLYDKMVHFEKNKFSSSLERIKDNFSIYNRTKDFKNIIKN